MRKGFTLIELMIVIAIIAIIAAIAIPNLLESRVTANEGAASASLKSGIFAAEVQFQGGSYLDRDQDNVGEYGTLRELAGLEPTNKMQTGQLRLLTGPLANAAVWSNTGAAASTAPALGVASGFRYAAYTPMDTDATENTFSITYDGQMAGSTTPASLSATDHTANGAERYWAAACTPQEWGNTGRHVFFIGADGQIRSPAAQSMINSVMTGSTDATALGNGFNGGTAPGLSVSRAIASGLYSAGAGASTAATAAPTSAQTVAVLMFDGTGYITFPIYSK